MVGEEVAERSSAVSNQEASTVPNGIDGAAPAPAATMQETAIGAATDGDSSKQKQIKPIATVLSKLDKWGDYEPCAFTCVAPTRFLPMKTPMSQAVLDNWEHPKPPTYPWTISHLMASQVSVGRHVGLILDLSNHDTLYGEDLRLAASLQYRHIQLVAKVLPSRETVQVVIREAQAFWSKHPDEHIAIHCAYGFNRTGFILVAYLVEVEGYTVDVALDSFAAARPPGVKHADFIEELYLRYHPEGPAAAATAASRAVAPIGADPAEPVLTSPKEAAAQPGSQLKGASLRHMHHAAMGNSLELTTAPPDSPPSSPLAPERDGGATLPEAQQQGSLADKDDCAHTRCRVPAASAAADAVVGGLATLTGRTKHWLRRSSHEERHAPVQAVTAGDTPPKSPFSAAAQHTPAVFRPTTWASRVQAATEGQDGEDNESLQADSIGGSGQLRGPSTSLSGMLWHNSPVPHEQPTPSHSFQQRLDRVSTAETPSAGSDLEDASVTGPGASHDVCQQSKLVHDALDTAPAAVLNGPAASAASAAAGQAGSVLDHQAPDAMVAATQPSLPPVAPGSEDAAQLGGGSRHVARQSRKPKRHACIVM